MRIVIGLVLSTLVLAATPAFANSTYHPGSFCRPNAGSNGVSGPEGASVAVSGFTAVFLCPVVAPPNANPSTIYVRVIDNHPSAAVTCHATAVNVTTGQLFTGPPSSSTGTGSVEVLPLLANSDLSTFRYINVVCTVPGAATQNGPRSYVIGYDLAP